MKYLIKQKIFNVDNYAKTLHEAIKHNEIPMSRKILENGGSIGSLLPIYRGIDFTFKTKKFAEYNIPVLDDLMWNKHRNVYWTEYDLIFVKGNRDIVLDSMATIVTKERECEDPLVGQTHRTDTYEREMMQHVIHLEERRRQWMG